jgi:hypothetical protein
MKITGQKANVFIDSFNSTDIVSTGSTTAKQKYFVISKGASSNIPVPAGTFFKAPSGTQITLVSGDKLFRINEQRFCKTSASFEFSQGSVDVSDDCNPGAQITDGIVSISGSLAGLWNYNDVTGGFDDLTDMILNHFLDIVSDNGTGTYTLSPRSDAQVYLLTRLNSGGVAGTTENWLFVPIVITSLSMNLGNSDPQSKELGFSRGEGQAIIYKNPV